MTMKTKFLQQIGKEDNKANILSFMNDFGFEEMRKTMLDDKLLSIHGLKENQVVHIMTNTQCYVSKENPNFHYDVFVFTASEDIYNPIKIIVAKCDSETNEYIETNMASLEEQNLLELADNLFEVIAEMLPEVTLENFETLK